VEVSDLLGLFSSLKKPYPKKKEGPVRKRRKRGDLGKKKRKRGVRQRLKSFRRMPQKKRLRYRGSELEEKKKWRLQFKSKEGGDFGDCAPRGRRRGEFEPKITERNKFRFEKKRKSSTDWREKSFLCVLTRGKY